MTLDHMLLNLSYLGFKILDRLEHNLGLNLFLQTTPQVVCCPQNAWERKSQCNSA